MNSTLGLKFILLCRLIRPLELTTNHANLSLINAGLSLHADAEELNFWMAVLVGSNA